MIKRLFSLVFFAFVLHTSFLAQERELPVAYDPAQAERAMKERNFSPRATDRTALTLPFFDDFSRFSQPTNDPSIPTDWQRWTDDNAYINGTYPLNPITIGVATLDGLNNLGFPYYYNSSENEGWPADTLTSLEIDLSNFTPADNIWLTFFYEGGGRGNAPNPADSLVLDFFTSSGADGWYPQWSVTGDLPQADSFYQAFVKLDQAEFFVSDFKMRFRSRATTGGNFDHWHLDWIYMNSGISDSTQILFDATHELANEVAFLYPNNTMLNDFTSVPWPHYQSNPASIMKTSMEVTQRNIKINSANISTGFRVDQDVNSWDFPNIDNNTSGNFFRKITRTIPLNGYYYDPTVNDSCATFDVRFFIDPIGYGQNDTAYFRQELINYYSYDDGSAERTYNVNLAGGSVAMRFDPIMPDTLLGFYAYWSPLWENGQPDPTLLNFFTRIWGTTTNALGQTVPGAELVENFTFYHPGFYDGYNKFVYYALDQPVPIESTFFVGWNQTDNGKINIGLDKNTNSNPGKLFYKSTAGEWTGSNIQGSIMIRPVFRAAKQIAGVDELQTLEGKIYPNPANDKLYLSLQEMQGQCQVEVFDLTGRKVLSESQSGQSQMTIDVSALPSAAYIVTAKNKTGGIFREVFIKE